MGASDREVLEAIRLIAEATGIDRDARVKVGQSIVLPDAIDRMVERLRSRPLVQLVPSWRPMEREAVDDLPLSDLAGVPVKKARAERFVGASNATLHPDALMTLNVTFGPLSKTRFDQLAAAFGDVSEAEHQRTRSYSLEDFLPPVVQALVNNDLEVPPAQRLAGTQGWSPKFPERSKEVSLDPNCHGTAYEVLSHYQAPRESVQLFFGEMLVMDDLVHQSGAFKKVTAASRLRLSRVGRQNLRPGDLVQFYEQTKWSRATTLLHSAVHVGCGIFFEKPNTEIMGEDSPYRLGTFEMISSPVLYAVDRMARVEVLRPVRSLAPAKETFRSGFADRLAQLERSSGRTIGHDIVQLLEHGLGGGISDEQLSAIVEVSLEVDEHGRSVIAKR